MAFSLKMNSSVAKLTRARAVSRLPPYYAVKLSISVSATPFILKL
jgi:hypothetical protein